MARESGGGVKGRRRVQPRDEDSEESDEEYKVTEDEDGDESDEYFSFDGEQSEDVSDGFKKSRRLGGSRNTRKGSTGRKRNVRVKPRKRRRVLYKEDDDDDEVAYEDDAEFTALGRKANPIKKPKEKKRVLARDMDDDYDEHDDGNDDEEEEDDDYAEYVSLVRKRDQRTKAQEDDDDEVADDDDYDEHDDGNDDDEEKDNDYAELVSSVRKKNQRKKPQEDDDDDDDDEVADEDDEEFVSLGRKTNQIKKPTEKKAVSYTEMDDDDDDCAGGGYDDVDVKEEDYAEVESSGRKKNQRKKPWENKRVIYTDGEEDDDVDEFVDEDEDSDVDFMYAGRKVNEKRNLREKRKVSYTEDDDNEDESTIISKTRKGNQIKEEPGEEKTVSYTDDLDQDKEDEKDAEFKLSESDFVDDEDECPKTKEAMEKKTVSYNDEDQEDEDEMDAEFKLSESDFVDDEDESPKMKNEKVRRSCPQKKSVRRGRKKNKKGKTKTPTGPKQRNHKLSSSYEEPVTNKNQVEKQRKKISKRRKHRVRADSDSDFVSSASSDHEYTLSEEEREQIREARVYCANLRAKLRSSLCGHEEEPAREQRKYPLRKGKEKIEDIKDETGKQVCGICLSEEGKRTVRGVLNCCRHYFCFSCIMEWSKVESRCPLCKQRFATITKAAKSDTGFDLRTVVIPVPECDQVYQPSEEELRGYLDPYESVICTECHNGGDDALMLLCDICDSSAHTFCVGLGQEVPEGNWYCDGCRPTVYSSLNSQRPTPTSDRRLSSSNASDLSSPVTGGFDLNEIYVPETPLIQQICLPSEPRLPVGDFVPSPTGTGGATTLRDRRRIRRQIHNRILNNNRMSGTSPSSSGVRLFGSQLDQRVAQPHASFNGREDHINNIMPSMHDVDLFSARADQFSVEVQNSRLTSVDVSLQGEHGGPDMAFDSRLGYPQLHPCTNRSSVSTDACREVIGPSRTSQNGFHAPF